ncbi:ABC transporter substrate-binding protein [Celeribacter indicus]|uniref:Extracellular solute-binding protein family 1 protein n=1 Tax=Celeribacter indicus TaxID=1208324 RepID=A0A0B5DZ94_9RHOB|nr:extracellular solute-binding protein [Celeribacter indicus]AJE48743.1 extracellular solute-binding protein family 1 protein [Celeribacter indicus]
MTLPTFAPVAAAAQEQELSGSIRFSWYGGTVRNQKIDEMVALFEDRHPGATIEQEPMDWMAYWERLSVQAAGDNMPCLVGMLPFNLPDYASRNLLLDMQPLVDEGMIDLSEISDSLIEASRTRDGALLMLPYGAAPDTITYNATLVEEAGLEVPGDGYTWDDYFDWLASSQEHLPNGVWAADNPTNNPDLLLAYIGSHGYQAFDDEQLGFPRELLIAWFQEWADLAEMGAVIPPDMLSEEPGPHEMSYFAEGRALASNRPANAQPALHSGVAQSGSDARLETLLYPLGPEGVGDFVPVNSLSIAASCKNLPLAAAFADFFLNDPEAAAIFVSDNGAVTNAALLAEQIADPETPEGSRILLEVFEAVNERGSVPQIFPSGFQTRFTEVHRRMIMEVFFGSLTPEEAADAFFAEAEQ